MNRPGLSFAAAIALAAALTLGSCSFSDSDSVTTDVIVMKEYEFVPKHLEVAHGTTLTVENEGKIAHNLVIARGTDPLAKPDKLLATDTFLGGRSERLKIDLPPGKYLMLCSVPGHRQLGMYGTITVR